MHFEDFAEGGSFLHRMDPRVKVISLVLFAGVVAVGNDTTPLVCALLFAGMLAGLANLEPAKLMQRLIVVNFFVAFLWLTLPFTTKGEPAFHLLMLNATKEGIALALTVTLKTNAIILATIALLGTSPIFSLVHALVHLKLPDKLVHLFFFCYRYISVLHREYTKLRFAMRVRCFVPGTGMHTYRSYAYLLGMLFVRSYDRSGRIYNAMLCRGFDGAYRTLHHFHFTPMDALAVAVMTGVTAGLALWQSGVLG